MYKRQIISQPRSTAAAAMGDAPESVVLDWDQDVGILMEDESEVEHPVEEESGSEVIVETDVPLGTETTEEVDENQEGVVSTFDVGDLFSDDEGGE